MGGRGSASGIGHSNKMVKLPQLKGSEKQINWANQIRDEAIKTADLNINLMKSRLKEYGESEIRRAELEAFKEVKKNLLEALQNIDSASVIINKRHIISGDMVLREAARIADKKREKRRT